MLTNEKLVNAALPAHIIGLLALGHVVADADLAARFLALSGLDADSLRATADDPAMLAAVIDFLAGHEADLIACAAALALPPQALVAAGARLSDGAA